MGRGSGQREYNKCKGPEVGVRLECVRNSGAGGCWLAGEEWKGIVGYEVMVVMGVYDVGYCQPC